MRGYLFTADTSGSNATKGGAGYGRRKLADQGLHIHLELVAAGMEGGAIFAGREPHDQNTFFADGVILRVRTGGCLRAAVKQPPIIAST